MLYRVVLVSNTVGAIGRDALSVAPILGQSERNNRRDEITAAMLFHEGQAALVVEGARTDLDRLMTRLERDARHDGMTVLSDRPVVQRRHSQAMQLSTPSAQRLAATMQGRRLTDLGASEIEALLSTDEAAQGAATDLESVQRRSFC